MKLFSLATSLTFALVAGLVFFLLFRSLGAVGSSAFAAAIGVWVAALAGSTTITPDRSRRVRG